MYYTKAGRSNSVDALTIDLAFMHLHLGQYNEANDLFTKHERINKTAQWSLVNYEILKAYGQCVLKTGDAGKYVDLILDILKQHDQLKPMDRQNWIQELQSNSSLPKASKSIF